MLKRTLAVLTAVMIASRWPVAAHAASRNVVITVGQGGAYNYHSIQQAVDAVPAYNDRAVTIRVSAGTYVGKVTIPATKPYITIQGAGVNKTRITTALNANTLLPDGTHMGTFNSASVTVYASDFTACDISFANSYGSEEQAAALRAKM